MGRRQLHEELLAGEEMEWEASGIVGSANCLSLVVARRSGAGSLQPAACHARLRAEASVITNPNNPGTPELEALQVRSRSQSAMVQLFHDTSLLRRAACKQP